MARQKGFMPLTGKWGNQIGFERNGKFFVRSAPTHVNQSPATRRASRRFGRYSRRGRVIRHAFYDDLDVRCDSTHINRLNKLLIEASGDPAALNGFRFNYHSGIDRFFSITPVLSRNGELHIPAQDIGQYGHFAKLEVKAIAVRIDFNTHRVTGTDSVLLHINPKEHFSGTTIPLYIAGEGTLMLTLQVRGIRSDGPSGNKQHLAADIIAVMPPKPAKRIKVHPHPRQTVEAKPSDLLNTPAHISHPLVQRE